MIAGMPAQGVVTIVVLAAGFVALLVLVHRARKRAIARKVAEVGEMLGAEGTHDVREDVVVDRYEGSLDGRPAAVEYRTQRTYPHLVTLELSVDAAAPGPETEIDLERHTGAAEPARRLRKRGYRVTEGEGRAAARKAHESEPDITADVLREDLLALVRLADADGPRGG